MKKHFLVPSESKKNEMLSKGFTPGHPVDAGWYLVAARSNDDEEKYFVHMVWFNPMSTDKFYAGAGSLSTKSEPYYLRDKVRAYANVPSL